MNDTFYNHTLKFIVIGESSVGKSNLLLQFTDKRFEQTHDVTIGVEFGTKIVSYDNTVYNIQVWDTAGQETYKAITKSYYRGAIGCLLIYDITNRETFEEVSKWLIDIRESNPENTNIILIGNKLDLEEYRHVSYEEGKKFADDNKIEFIETSAKTGKNVNSSFIKMVKNIDTKIKNGELSFDNKQNSITLSNDTDNYTYGCYC